MKAKLWRGLRKFFAGVPLGGERVWPGEATDLFVAHQSIYQFFARHAAGKRLLDAGCGLGYGSAMLLAAEARSVLGVDIDPRAIAFAQRHYARAGLSFQVADCEQLAFEAGSFDLVVSSNTLEHLRAPERFVMEAHHALAEKGEMIIAVPPNNDPRLQADNERNPHHHANLDIAGWIEIFENVGFSVRTFQHTHSRMDALDFASGQPSQWAPESFAFVEVAPNVLARNLTLTAVFVAQPRT